MQRAHGYGWRSLNKRARARVEVEFMMYSVLIKLVGFFESSVANAVSCGYFTNLS